MRKTSWFKRTVTKKIPVGSLLPARNTWQALLLILLVGTIGSLLLLFSQASTPTASVEPESGAVTSPATNVTDSSASGGSAVIFGTGSMAIRHINDRGIGFNYTDYPSHTPEQMQRDFAGMKAMGATWVRLGISWNVIQAAGSTSYQWTTYDTYVNYAVDAGLKVDGIVMFTPTWAVSQACKDDTSIPQKQICPAADPNVYAQFAQTVVQRYGQKLSSVEIWNEPNIYQFWRPAPDAVGYVAMLKAAYTAIKAVDPTMLVISAGLSPASNSAPHYINQITYLQKMYALGAKNYMDAVGYHPYDGAWPADYYRTDSPWSQIFQTPTSLHSVMATNGDGAKRIWLTEYGAPNGGAGAPYPSTAGIATCANYITIAGRPTVDDCLQSLILSKAVAADLQNSNVLGPLLIYAYLDRGSPGQDNSQENHYGVLNTDLSHKQSYDAVVAAIAANQ